MPELVRHDGDVGITARDLKFPRRESITLLPEVDPLWPGPNNIG
jgi:hypothetical protein